MRKYALTLLLIIFSLYGLKAQKVLNGYKGIDVNINKTDLGFLFGGGYVQYINNNVFMHGNFGIETGKPYGLKYTSINLDALAHYKLFSIAETVNINPGLGLTLNYQNVSPVEQQYKNAFGYGIKGGAEVETFLEEQLSFFVRGYQTYLIKAKLGNSRYDFGVGVRILF